MNDSVDPESPVPPPSVPSTPAQAPVPTGRRRFAAAVVAGSLVIGGAAGLGGAAIWTSTHPTAPATSPSTSVAAPAVAAPVSGRAKGVEAVAAAVLPSVVKIDVSGPSGTGSGSGIVLTSDGKILTNNHVVAGVGAQGDIVVHFSDGTQVAGTVVGTDPLTDTAVVRAKGVSGLTPATLGTTHTVRVGQQVVAVGSPFGLDATVTTGIVSALERPVNVGTDSSGNATTYPAIQTDAAINPGNSGGPLVDLSGRVVGMNASIRAADQGTFSSGQAGSIGLGFAIPIDEITPIVDQLLAGQTPTHARLGVSVADATSGDLAEPDGARVQDVTQGSAAAAAGIRVGDVITALDGTPVSSADSLVASVRSLRPGDRATVSYQRDGVSHRARMTLESDAAAARS